MPGQEFGVKVHVDNPSERADAESRCGWKRPAGEAWAVRRMRRCPRALPPETGDRSAIHGTRAGNAAATRPYFTRPNDEQPYYDIRDERYRNLSLTPYPLAAWVEFRLRRRAGADGASGANGAADQRARARC